MKAFHLGIALLAAGSLVVARLVYKQVVEKTDGAEYVEEHSYALVLWMRDAYPEILDEFLEYAPAYRCQRYEDWLN